MSDVWLILFRINWVYRRLFILGHFLGQNPRVWHPGNTLIGLMLFVYPSRLPKLSKSCPIVLACPMICPKSVHKMRLHQIVILSRKYLVWNTIIGTGQLREGRHP